MAIALIVDRKVEQLDLTLSEITDEQRDSGWRVVDSSVTPGMLLQDDGRLIAPSVALYADLAEARNAMVRWIDGFLLQITGPVPDFERASWPAKAAAARAFLAGTASADQAALLAGEAETSGRDINAVAAVVTMRADQYEAIVSRSAGLRVALDVALEAEASKEEPNPHNYEIILNNGKAQAVALAASLGIGVAS